MPLIALLLDRAGMLWAQEVEDNREQHHHRQDDQRNFSSRVGRGALDLAGLAVDEEAVNLASVFVGRDPHRQQHMFKAHPRKLMRGPDVALGVARNVMQTAGTLQVAKLGARHLPAFAQLDGVALCREAQQILTGKGKESRSIEAMDLSRELFGESA